MNARQERFLNEYMIDQNATQAALRAGYSPKTAYSQGQRLLKDVEVAAEIRTRQGALAQKAGITAERVIAELARLGFYNAADAVNPDEPITCPEDIKRLPEDIQRAIVGWRYDPRGRFVLKFAEKKGALDSLGRHLGLFNDSLEVNVTQGLAERLARAKARSAPEAIPLRPVASLPAPAAPLPAPVALPEPEATPEPPKPEPKLMRRPVAPRMIPPSRHQMPLPGDGPINADYDPHN